MSSKFPNIPVINPKPKVAPVPKNGPSSPTVASPTDKAPGSPILEQFRQQLRKGSLAHWDTSFLGSVIDAIGHSDAIDDRRLLLEHVLSVLCKLPEGAIANKLAITTVELLYNDLAHPPSSYIGNEYAWRTADGSYNNICVPDMGKSGTPYARSVQQTHPLPKHAMPDAGLVFDTLLRREGFVKHPAGLSSLMFGFAALVIHSVFRTSHTNVTINDMSSYVDLSPLYGANQKELDKIRKFDGRGLLWPDTFAEDRLLLLPPSVCSILVLFNRNHNFIAERIFEINERGTFSDPATLSPEAQRAQDEAVFQTARLCNCAWFAGVVFSDYFSCILGLVRQGSSWVLNPFGELRKEDHSFFERGQGNVCSVEFNCLYRWHATTSAEDEKWVQTALSRVFHGQDLETLTVDDFKTAAIKIKASEPDIHHWTFGAMSRQQDGTFKDEELANILHNATEHPAGAFRARGTPPCMRPHEIMGIESNRAWGVCSMNDFRRFLGLKAFTSFEEWNSDPAIHETAQKLYGNIEHLELYVGLQAEEAKPVVDGAGLCPGYTISRAILADAIALTRGDRFYTADFTPFNLTSWGFADCQRDPAGFGFGSMLGRLILRTLPTQFTYNSVYTWFPLMIPNEMKPHLEKLKLSGKYDLARPGTTKTPQSVTGYAEVAAILKDDEKFASPYVGCAGDLIKGDGFYIAEGGAKGDKHTKEIIGVLAPSPKDAKAIGQYFYEKVTELMDKYAFANVGGKINNVDIVRDVLKAAPIHWAATEIAGIQLSNGNSEKNYSEEELFDVIGAIYSYIFLDVEQEKLANLKDSAKENVNDLLKLIKNNLILGPVKRLSVPGLMNTVSQLLTRPHQTERSLFVKGLHELGHDHNQLANSVLAILIGSTVELSLLLTNVVNKLLDSEIREKVAPLAKASDAEKLHPYVNEAIRLDPPFRGVYRTSTKAQTIASSSVEKDQKVLLDVAAAGLDQTAFPNPNAVDASRDKEKYFSCHIVSKCLGKDITSEIIAGVLRAIFSRDNVRRGPGQSGKLPRFATSSPITLVHGYLDTKQCIAPWPTSLVIQWDVKNSAATEKKA